MNAELEALFFQKLQQMIQLCQQHSILDISRNAIIVNQ